jgi:hypothetical protein
MLINALPAMHAYTGSDYTASFMGKGKLKALQLITKHESFRKAFASLGDTEVVTPECLLANEKFTCALYGFPKLSSINDTRYALFQQMYAPKWSGDCLGKIQGINPSSMPTC